MVARLTRTVIASAAVLIGVALPPIAAPASADLPSGWTQGSAQLTYTGSVIMSAAGDPPISFGALPPLIPGNQEFDPHGLPGNSGLRAMNLFGQKPPLVNLPSATGTSLTVGPAGSGFDGLSQLDQRLADGGHQPNITPPDQALCVGGGFVLEGVNSGWQVFSMEGTALTNPIATGPFFGDGHQVISRNPNVWGTWHADPRCIYDPDTGRFYATDLRYPLTNAVHTEQIELAVSRTGDPRGIWDHYLLDTTADGTNGSPAIPGCPCSGDFDRLGVDGNGVYITSSELSQTNFTLSGLAGERYFALSKWQLAARTATSAVTLTEVASNPSSQPFPWQPAPAQTPADAAYDTEAGGTEYFVSSSYVSGDNHLYLFALTNTSSLATATPSLSISEQDLATESTTEIPLASQPDGFRPLANWIQQQTGGPLPPVELTGEGALQDQAYWAAGRLWTSRRTAVKPQNGRERAGLAWFQIIPHVAGSQVNASIAKQGYLAIDQNNATDGAIAVDSTGHGVIAFTVIGPDYYPSQAYAPIDEEGVGPATMVAQGTVPIDNVDGYAYFGASNRFARFGDYSAAVTTGTGDYWTAAEYTPNVPRVLQYAWSTRITRIH